MLTFAVGDIHGRNDLLQLALAEIETFDGPKRIVFLGDYVDRGPDSKDVLETLMGLNQEENYFLMGNHEQLMLDALSNSATLHDDQMWAMNGGDKTLDSYEGQVPEEHLNWLKSLRYMLVDEVGRVFVHAGIDPRVSLEYQMAATVIWIRNVFLDVAELPAYVVHGHTHTHRNKRLSEVEDLPHRCNLDTGAYHTGILSIAVFNEFQTRPERIIQVGL